MRKIQLRMPSPAMIVAMVALVVAVAGTAVAGVAAISKISGKTVKKNTLPGNRIKQNTVTGKQVKESSLATVPSADNANTLGGQGPGAFAPSAIEAPHVVGNPGEPVYENGWEVPGETDAPVSFYKDSYGIVHLQGSALRTSASTAVVFTLPTGYRPAKHLYYAVYAPGGDGLVQIASDGAVDPFGSTDYIGLSNVTFRAGV